MRVLSIKVHIQKKVWKLIICTSYMLWLKSQKKKKKRDIKSKPFKMVSMGEKIKALVQKF